jgi:hypothetical protein
VPGGEVSTRAFLLALGIAALVDCRPRPACPVTKVMVWSPPHPMTCEPDPDATPCLTCLRASCCEQVRACDAEERPCRVLLAFFVEDGRARSMEKGTEDAVSEALNACRLERCRAVCSLEE